jgi:hypothetical protein
MPEKCINLYDPKGWRRIRAFIKRTAPASELAAAANIPADRIFEDEMNKVLPSYDMLAFELRVYLEAHGFSFLGVHCCRPLTLCDYYREGFLPLSDSHALRLIRDYAGGDLCDKDAAVALAALDLGCRKGVVMFCVGQPEDVDDHSRHYLVIGPEFFCEITNDYSVPCELREKFSNALERSLKRAVPTLFSVAVPFDKMSSRGKDWVISQLIVGHLWLGSVVPKKSKDWGRDMSLECDVPVPASAIIGHTHPAKITHYLLGPRTVLEGHPTKCDFC